MFLDGDDPRGGISEPRIDNFAVVVSIVTIVDRIGKTIVKLVTVGSLSIQGTMMDRHQV
jgi:hypothetical protein